jgi:hypothetical protein
VHQQDRGGDVMASEQILYPSFAMFVLVAFVLVKLARLRVAAVGSREVDVRFYRTYQEGQEPEHIRVVTRHFINQFEVPTLFHVIVVIAYVTKRVSWWTVALAWAYVAGRCLHSYVHLGTNDVLMRFRMYFASNLVLALLWLSVFGSILLAG